MSPKRVWTFALTLMLVLMSETVMAQTGTVVPQTRSGGAITAGNGSMGWTLLGAFMDDEVVRDGGLFDSGEFERTYRGLDASGAPGETRFQSRIVAQTRPLRFGASASLRLIEPRVNRLNPPYIVRDGTGHFVGVDPDGMPDVFGALASSYVADEVRVESASPIAHVRLHVSIRGTIDLPDDFPLDRPVASASLAQLVGKWPDLPLSFGVPPLFFTREGPQSFDLWTAPIPVVGGRFGFGLGFASYIQATLNSAEDELREWSFTVDFLDGVTINYVQGFDSRGEPVTLSSATGALGTRYPTAPVPEPGTFASILVGLGLVGAVFRRRIPARDATASRR